MGLGKTYSTKYLLDSNNNSGVAGQVLSTTSTGIDWVDANTVPGSGLWLENGNDIYNSNSGNVGIGVTSPAQKLHVIGKTISSVDLTVGNNSSGAVRYSGQNGYYSFITRSNYNDWSLSLLGTDGDASTDPIGTQLVTVNYTGNVGIGTTSPNAPLQIASTNKTIDGTLGGSNLSVYTTDTQAANVGASIGLGGMSTTPAGFEFYGTMAGRKENSTNLDSSGYIAFYTQRVAVGHVERMRIDSLGNVGINSTAYLGFNGAGDASHSVGYNAGIDGVQLRGQNGVIFGTGGGATAVERMRIDSSGNIGIGGDTSAWSLGKTIQINGNYGTINYNGVSAILGIVNAYYNGSGYIRQNVGYAGSIDFNTAVANGGFAFRTENSTGAAGDTLSLTTKVAILSNGNVGIGTTTPDLGGVAGTRVLTIASPTAERWGILELAGNRTWGGNQVGELKFISTDATNNGTLVSLTAINDPTATGTGGGLKFNTRNNGGSLTERMHIQSNGQVNINQKPNSGLAYDVLINLGTSPDGLIGYQTVDQLAVNLGASTSSNWVKSGNDIYNTNSANVGIGVTSPQRPLHVNGTEGVARFTSTASGNSGFEVGIGTASQAFLWQTENSYMHFATNGTERMRITSGGSVGILTDDPVTYYKGLTVSGGGGAPFISFNTETQRNLGQFTRIVSDTLGINFFTSATGGLSPDTHFSSMTLCLKNGGTGVGGLVGIGTITPGAKLDVNGATYVRSVIYGYAGGGNQYGGLSWNSTDDGFLFLKSANVTKVNINSNGDSYFNGGNVGIGVTGPGEKLEIDGNIRIYNSSNAPYIDFTESGAATDSKARITMDQIDTDNGTLIFGTENAGTLFNQMKLTQAGSLLFSDDAASFNTTLAKVNMVPASNSVYQQWSYSPGNDNFSLVLRQEVTSGNVRYVFDQTNVGTAYPSVLAFNQGNVGIGTYDPLGKLMVRDDTAGAPTRLIVSNGGTAQSGTSARLSFYEGTSEKGYIERRRDGSGKIAFVTPADDNPFVWENPTGEIMRINNGNVGIGETNPKAPGGTAATTLTLKATNFPQFISVASNATANSTTWRSIARNNLVYQIQTVNDAITTEQNAYEIKRTAGSNAIEYQRWYGGTTEAMRITSAGAIKFNAYGAGTLVTDASGNITASSGGGAGGPFLPLAGGTMSGGIVFSSQDGAACTPVNWLSYLCPDSSGTTVNAKIGEGVVIFPDSSKVTFGDGQDLEIYHNGSDSYIKDAGIGDLRIVASLTKIYDADMSHLQASFTDGGSVDLYYGGNKKFETTSTGISVEGQGIFTGNVGIGVTGPDVKLQVTASEDGSGIDKGTAKFINTATGSGATTMHIVQTTASSFGNAIKFWQGSTPTAVGFIRLTTSATQFITSASDLNLKKNITNWSDNTLSKFKALEPKKFRFKTQDASEDKTLGFIAQNEVDNFPEAYPQFLGEDEKPYYGFNPSGMVPHLMKAIKDLVEKVEILENKITQLEN